MEMTHEERQEYARQRSLSREREREVERQQDRERGFRRQLPNNPQHPVQNHAGSIPIHQPVASKSSSNMNILSNLTTAHIQRERLGMNVNNPPGGGLFNAPQQGPEETSGPYMHQPVQPPPQQSMAPGGAGPSPMQGNGPALAQGQQPILNVSIVPERCPGDLSAMWGDRLTNAD